MPAGLVGSQGDSDRRRAAAIGLSNLDIWFRRTPAVATTRTAAAIAAIPIVCRYDIGCSRRAGLLVCGTWLAGALRLRLVEIARIRRRLAFAYRHQQAVLAHDVVFLADDDVIVVPRCIGIRPRRAWGRAECFGHRPGLGQRVVDRGDLVAQESLFFGSSPMRSWRSSRCPCATAYRSLVSPRALDPASLDLERIVAAVIVLSANADRVADGGLLSLGEPLPSV